MPQTLTSNSSARNDFPVEYHRALINGLIHKLNNLITVIAGHTGLLLLEPKLSRKVREPLEHMAVAAQLLSRFIDEAAILSKPTPLKLEPVAIARLFRSLELPDGIRFVCDFPRHASVLADQKKVKRILEEIGRNAHAAEAKTVKCTVRSLRNRYAIQLRDDGTGIKPEVLHRIFDPFFTTRRRGDFLGVGLFRAHAELSRMHGQITVTSDGESYTQVVIILRRSNR